MLLPNPDGELSSRIPSVAIASANRSVRDTITSEDSPNTEDSMTIGDKKCGPYLTYTEEEKAKIAKKVVEFGVTSTICYFQKKFSD